MGREMPGHIAVPMRGSSLTSRRARIAFRRMKIPVFMFP